MRTADEAAAEFWDFSLELYGLPGVAAAALRLQDEEGRDVNLALFALYAGLVQGRRLDAPALLRLNDAVSGWNEAAVRPLRAIRRALKPHLAEPGVASFRRRLQELELEAERRAQSRLVAALEPVEETLSASFDLARTNLLLYAGDAAQGLLAAVRDGLSEAAETGGG